MVAAVVGAVIGSGFTFLGTFLEHQWSEDQAVAAKAAENRTRLASVVIWHIGILDGQATEALQFGANVTRTPPYQEAIRVLLATEPAFVVAVFSLDPTEELAQRLQELEGLFNDLLSPELTRDARHDAYLRYLQASANTRAYLEEIK